MEARMNELLPVKYFHVVFTLPHELNALVMGNLVRQRFALPAYPFGRPQMAGSCAVNQRRAAHLGATTELSPPCALHRQRGRGRQAIELGEPKKRHPSGIPVSLRGDGTYV